MTEAITVAWKATCAGFHLDEALEVWQWADRFRVLPSVGGAEPGPYLTDRTPYLREIMVCLSPQHPCREIVVSKAAQVGATECMANWIGYIAHKVPAPTIMLQPTVEAAQRYSKQRLAPTIRETPVLREIINDPKSRDSGNTIMVKEFPGGMLMLTGANSPVGLASTPAKNLALDEIDRYPGDVGGEGDPIKIITARTTTFPDRKIFKASTPTIKGFSRIEREWKRSDQRRYHVPCVFCGALQPLEFARLKWEKDADGNHLPETVKYECAHCGQLVPERYKTDLLAAGSWVPENPTSKIPGFHINGLLRPIGWKGWVEIVADFLEAREDPALLKVFMNTELGETWEETGERVEALPLMERREEYGPAVPMLAGFLTAGVDIQDDRLEVLVLAWGLKGESWAMSWQQFPGNPAKLELWDRLEDFLRRPGAHESGAPMRIAAVALDTGGHYTREAYEFVRRCRKETRRERLPIFATKGSSQEGKPIVSRPTRSNILRIPLYPVGTDTAKDAIMARLRIQEPGPGYLHFPQWADEEFFKQLTAEEVRKKYTNGHPRRVYLKRYRNNEIFDMYVLNLVALSIANVSQEYLQRRIDKLQNYDGPKVEPQQEPPADPVMEEVKQQRQRRVHRPRGQNWVTKGTSWGRGGGLW